jgi:hypothetical protein
MQGGNHREAEQIQCRQADDHGNLGKTGNRP